MKWLTWYNLTLDAIAALWITVCTVCMSAAMIYFAWSYLAWQEEFIVLIIATAFLELLAIVGVWRMWWVFRKVYY